MTLAGNVLRPALKWLMLLLLTRSAAAQNSLDDLAFDGSSSPSSSSAGVGFETTNSESASDESTCAAGNHAEVNGYFANRESYNHINPFGPVSTRDVPSLSLLTEANLQLRVNLGTRTNFAYADTSLIAQRGGLYYVDNGHGGRTRIADHDVPGLRPVFVPSELYVSYSPRPWLNLLAGKKRITWGSGFAANPTDLINPPKIRLIPTTNGRVIGSHGSRLRSKSSR
ncbi:MAG: hypothetical protein QM784_29240 [Polyangiaceae bacterium]